ncbi:MAG: glycosyltransferase family 2 protein [Acidobacteriaceae bacterium]
MKITAIVLIYNSRKFIPAVFDSIQSQTFKDLETVAVINGDNDGSEKMIREKYPKVKIINPGGNLYFSKGNNLAIKQSDGELLLLVNHDLVLENDYAEKLAHAFNDPSVGAATGKLLRYDFDKGEKTNTIDSTGITMNASGRARDRGQLQEDHGQFDDQTNVFAVSGAGPMYRRSALEKTKYCANGICEYFDEDFEAYWEDVDLSWRLNRAGFKNVYVPEAKAYHGRTAGQSKGGYFHFFHFIKHHRQISPNIRKLNYRNHILMYLKNSPSVSLRFIFRELLMLVYVTIFETSTLAIVPSLIKLIPKELEKSRSLNKPTL